MSSPEDYMFPCFWKKNFNFECFGCGMQRSVALILDGEFIAAFYMYPAIYTAIILFGFLLVHIKYQFRNGHKILLCLFIINVILIITNYILKFI